jgi:hypothetical protein
MHFLIFMDGLRADVLWIIWAMMLGLPVYLIWAPKIARGWRKNVMRVAGTLLAIVFVCASLVLGLGILMGADPPREHKGFTSATGERVALLSHSTLRDASATEIAVKQGCCRRLIAYEYFGDGDDYMDGTSVRWIDDHHLVIRYVLDPTGQQTCRPKVGDVIVSCVPHADSTAQPQL